MLKYYIPSTINYGEAPSDDVLYSKWTKWSRCRKKCRQVRRRRCINYERCGKTILKETRPCNKGRSCRNRNNRQRGNKLSYFHNQIYVISWEMNSNQMTLLGVSHCSIVRYSLLKQVCTYLRNDIALIIA